MQLKSRRSFETLTYSLPILAACIFIQLAYFPAQMSSDSVDQWWQISNGRYSDAHPLMSSLFYKFFHEIYPSPAFVILCQSIIFSISIGLLISAMRRAGMPGFWAMLTAILMALFPPNILLATTMWKDVPYTIGIILVTAALVKLAQDKMRLRRLSAILLIVGSIFVISTRHNGILVIAPMLIALLFFVKSAERTKIAGILALQIVCFILSKTVLLWAFNAAPIDRSYAGIFALPIIGAMVTNNEELDEETNNIVTQVMPLASWKEGYSCSSVVPLFWHKDISRNSFRANVTQLNLIALNWAFTHPRQFIVHQLCMTNILWNPVPLKSQWIAVAPLGITQFQLSQDLGLKTESKLPSVKNWMDQSLSVKMSAHRPWNQPATYMWLGLFSTLLLAYYIGPRWLIIALPMLLNMLSLIPLIGSQDYRYMWPSAVIGIALTLFALAHFSSYWRGKNTPPKRNLR